MEKVRTVSEPRYEIQNCLPKKLGIDCQFSILLHEWISSAVLIKYRIMTIVTNKEMYKNFLQNENNKKDEYWDTFDFSDSIIYINFNVYISNVSLKIENCEKRYQMNLSLIKESYCIVERLGPNIAIHIYSIRTMVRILAGEETLLDPPSCLIDNLHTLLVPLSQYVL